MVGRNGRKRLDQLIDEVARGERRLTSISDAKLREAVRLALRIHADAPVSPDVYAKRRMRARVMAGLEPRRATLLDNAWTALELLARPAPYIARGVAAVSVLACMGMGALVASADTLPDDLLYPVKLATEQVRLALADAPGDRATVELSIASHRLSEAEQLAGSGRTSDALVASDRRSYSRSRDLLIGAGVGFLWYNAFPAEVIMGDTGAMAIGGALAAFAIFTKTIFLLLLIGGIFVIEALSVIIQVVAFKYYGRRVFLIAPIHYHFEMKAWSETKIMVRFWIACAILCALAFAFYYRYYFKFFR